MFVRRVFSSLVVSSSLLALSLPAQAAGPDFLDATGFYKSFAQTYAVPHKTARGGWGMDYRGMSAHDPALSRVRRMDLQNSGRYRAPAGNRADQARAYINHYARQLGIESYESGALERIATHELSDGAAIVQFQQRVNGIEVFGPQLSLLIDAQGRLAALSGSLHTHLRVQGKGFSRSALPVMQDVLAHHGVRGLRLNQQSYSNTQYSRYTADASARSQGVGEDLRSKPLYVPTAEGLVPAYYVEFSKANEGHEGHGHSQAGHFVVARVSDSRILFQKSLTHEDSFKYRVWAHEDARNTPLDNPLLDFTPHPTGKPDSAQPGVPAESRVVTMEGFNTNPEGKVDPWLPAGATETKGNNVDAYTDRDQVTDPDTKEVSNDGFTEGDIRAKVNENGDFDWKFDLNKEPNASEEQMMAAVTQVFYTTNWLHDYWYDLGWDEKSGNAQMDNFGRGGKDSDPLLAQAQDSADSGQRNNANMTVFPDGKSPRMQMYLWSNKDKVRKISTEPAVDGLLNETNTANYGKQTFKVTAPLVLVKDPEEPFEDGCQDVADPSTVAGKIVIVQMGFQPGEDPTCKSIQRAALLQKAGAVGMIFMDSTERVPMLGGDWPEEVTIPALSINKSNGDRLLKAIKEGEVTMTMERESSAEIDGSIDNQVVAHEWGHYAHLRLVRCGGNGCYSMSEGWADYFALHMSMREGDDFKAVYPVAIYASAGRANDPFYFGLRRYPYSVNKKVNPLMFHHIADGQKLPSNEEVPQQPSGQPMSEVHNAGEVWAQILMDVEHQLHLANAKKATPLDWDGVHRLMGEYLVAGMKLTPPQPTWTEQRDAILAVARARNQEDFVAMAKGFAGRGMGTCAVSPAADSPDNVGATSNEDITGKMEFRSWKLDDSQTSCDSDGFLDVNEVGKLTVSLRNVGMDLLKATTVEVKSMDDALVVDSTGPLPASKIEIDKDATIAVPVRLIKAPANGSTLPIQIILKDENSCLKTIEVDVKPRVDFDEVPASTDMETFESRGELWKAVKLIAEAEQQAWERISETPNDESNHVWRGRDLGMRSDSVLVSPALKAKADENFVIDFEHAYSFESSKKDETIVNWDGALIEYSVDGGTTWEDIKDVVVNPEYNGPIGNVDKSVNSLTGRTGYVGTSPGYPARSSVRLDFGRKVAGKSVQIRFRIGTDALSGAPGWVIDNLQVRGVEGTPFTKLVPDACEGSGGTGDTTDGAGTGEGTGGTGGGEGTGGGGDGTGTGGGAGSPPGGGEKAKDMGCGCSASSSPEGSIAAGLGLFALAFWRRRKDKRA